MPITVDPSEVQRIEVDPGQVTPYQKPDEKPGALSTFLSAAGSRLNPLNMIKGAGETLSSFADHPIDSMISNSPVGAIQRAKEAYDRGDMREAVVHLGSAFMPGPPVEEQTGVKLAHGQYAEGFGDLAGDVAAALIPMGVSKAGTALRGSEAAGFARDVLAHPKVTAAIKNAVKDSIKQGLREVPGVKTIETVGKGAVTAKGVIDDVRAARAARNAPAAEPAPQPSRIIQAGPMDRLNARASVSSEGNVPSTPGPVDAGPPAAEAPPVAAAQPEPIESSPGIVKPRLTVDPAEVQAISAASPEPAVSPAASPEAAAAAEPAKNPLDAEIERARSAGARFYIDPAGDPKIGPGHPGSRYQKVPEQVASPADPIATPADEVPRPEIQRTPVTQYNPKGSTNIEAIGYHPESQTMHVEFKGGTPENPRVYEYVGVTPEEHAALIKAESIGSHFARKIKPRFPTEGELLGRLARDADAGAQIDLPGTGTESPVEAPAGPATLPANGGKTIEAGGSPAGPSQGLPPAKPTPSSNQPGQGAETDVLIPGETGAYKARYEVRELKDVQSSHNGQTFQPNPKYALQNERDYTTPENQGKVVNGALKGNFNPRYHITDNPDASNGPPLLDQNGNAIGGNGRTMTLQRVYASNPEGAQAYKDLLTEKAQQFGIDPEHVQKLKQPVLLRVVSDDSLTNRGNAIADFNKKGTAELTPAERAIADSRRVSQGTLDDLASRLDDIGPDATLSKALAGEHGPQILRKLIDDGVISEQELAAYKSGDKLTKQGQERISKLLLGRFFRDPAQLDTIPPVIASKLERIAAPLSKLEGSGEWNLTPRIREAMDLIEEAHAHGTKNLTEFIKQPGLFGEQRYNADAVKLAKVFQRMSSGKLTEAVKGYIRKEHFAQEHAQAKAGMFGDSVEGEAPEAAQSFQEAFSPNAKEISKPVAPEPVQAPETIVEKLSRQLNELMNDTSGSFGKQKPKAGKLLSKQQMIDRGADGYLNSALEMDVPLDQLDGLEPVPASDEPGGQYTPGRKITQPIEVAYDKESGKYVVYGGNHRIAQARANGQATIRAFVERPPTQAQKIGDQLLR